MTSSPPPTERVRSGSERPSIVVVGAGVFGVWTALEMQQRGATVTLLDAWGVGNTRSSSGGESRIFRTAYGGDRLSTDLAARSLEAWSQLGERQGLQLFRPTGLLWIFRNGDDGTRRAEYMDRARPLCADLGFPVTPVALSEASHRWPQIDFQDVCEVFFEERAGILSARPACTSSLRAFLAAGGSYRIGAARPGRRQGRRLLDVTQSDGTRQKADRFVFACGPWLATLFPELLAALLRPTRQEVFFFGTPSGSDRYRPDKLPIWIEFGDRILYGFPDSARRGLKIGDDTRGPTLDPSASDRTVPAPRVERARRDLGRRFPELEHAPLLESRVCQYSNTPDGHLIADWHPEADNVFLLGGGSGHGFKLAPALASLAAGAILDGDSLPSDFGLRRFGSGAPSQPRTQFQR